MIPKFICLIFGHKKFDREDFVKNGRYMYRKVPQSCCLRCTKYLGKWWEGEIVKDNYIA
jgi:hypothetical protein